MKVHFTKMHGLGNDFILIDCRGQACPSGTKNLQDISRQLCDRRFGIGADQILLLGNSSKADFQMRILNADGSEVEMCGNGIRCLAQYIWDRRLSEKDVLEIETLAGIMKPERSGDMIKVDMGEPIFEPEKIPVRLTRESNPPLPPFSKGGMGGIIDYPLQVADREFNITCISMGNPHAVIVVDDVSGFPVTYYGPMIETHSIFPRKTNVEFIQVLNRAEIKMRVWERGSGETMACGTGAAAAAVASSLKGLTEKTVTVHLLGGDLLIEQAVNKHVYMTGPAVEVFEGSVDIS
ncbi:MAG: diaminopimelate epimerase [Nitrospirota bacterium]